MQDNGVSPLLGLVLALAIVVGLIGVIQNVFVPKWIKEKEWDHYIQLKNEFEKLTEKAVDASNTGLAIQRFNLRIDYPDYPFLMTPNQGSSLLEIEKIGTLKITGGANPVTVDVYAIAFVPNYYQLKVNKEYFILGEIYTETGKLLSDELIYGKVGNNISVSLISVNATPGVYSGVKTIKLYANPDEVLRLNGADITVNITVDNPKWSWYIKSLANRIKNQNGSVLTDNSTYVNFTATNANIFVSAIGFDIPVKEKILGIPAKYLNITSESGQQLTVYNGSNATLNMSILHIFQDQKKNENKNFSVVAATVYITGMLGFSNYPVDAKVDYHFTWIEGGVTYETWWNTSFTWFTLPNGYIQLPIIVPGLGQAKKTIKDGNIDKLEVKQKTVSDYAIVTLKYADNVISFRINFDYGPAVKVK